MHIISISPNTTGLNPEGFEGLEKKRVTFFLEGTFQKVSGLVSPNRVSSFGSRIVSL